MTYLVKIAVLDEELTRIGTLHMNVEAGTLEEAAFIAGIRISNVTKDKCSLVLVSVSS